MGQKSINQQHIRRQRIKYIVADIVSVLIAWVLFFVFRRIEIESNVIREIQLFSPVYNFKELLFGIPFFWLFIFWLSGYYNQPYRKSRLTELAQTFLSTFFGSIALFFILLLDDPVVDYRDYYLSLIVLFAIYFSVVYLFRYTITLIATRQIHTRKIGFNTLIVGAGKNAKAIYDELESMKMSSGHFIQGFISCEGEQVAEGLNVLGDLSRLDDIVKEKEIREVIIAMDSVDRDAIFPAIHKLYQYDVIVRLIPRVYDFLIGSIRIVSIYGTPLVTALEVPMNDFEKNVKFLFDKVFSCVMLILLSPLLLILSILVKLSSDGPILYQQERIGLYGKPFKILKFRTMRMDAEASGPQLAKEGDNRVTKIGHYYRKYRFDELPQFINVLRGDMSIVGPRPERKYFGEKIAEKAPYYGLVHRVKPGITSWATVKYGYASDIDQMVRRLHYDIIYLDNTSLLVDLKILIYTVITVVTGRGL